MNKAGKLFKRVIRSSFFVFFTFAVILSFATVEKVSAQEKNVSSSITAEEAIVQKFGLIAAAVAFGFGAIGAGLAISKVGAAAMGAIGEKPEVAGQALIFVALAEGVVVFGFITALMILGKF